MPPASPELRDADALERGTSEGSAAPEMSVDPAANSYMSIMEVSYVELLILAFQGMSRR